MDVTVIGGIPVPDERPTPPRAPWRDRSWCVHETVVGWRCGTKDDRRFLALALLGEVGEFANLVKKEWRAQWGRNHGNLLDAMLEELADVTIYYWLLCRAYGLARVGHFDLTEIEMGDLRTGGGMIGSGLVELETWTRRLGTDVGRLVDVCGDGFDIYPVCEECGSEVEERGVERLLGFTAEAIVTLWQILAGRKWPAVPGEPHPSRAAIRLCETVCAAKEWKVAIEYGRTNVAVERALATIERDAAAGAKNSHGGEGGAAAS